MVPCRPPSPPVPSLNCCWSRSVRLACTKVQNSRRKRAVRDRAPLTFHFSWSKIIRAPSPSPPVLALAGPPLSSPPIFCRAFRRIISRRRPADRDRSLRGVMDTEIDRARTILRMGLLICGGGFVPRPNAAWPTFARRWETENARGRAFCPAFWPFMGLAAGDVLRHEGTQTSILSI